MKKLISLILTAVMLLSAVITVNAASFSDVKSSDWFYTSVNYVADKGIMHGTSSTKFSPKASLTRAMGVTLLYRVAGTPSVSGVNIPFTDVKSGQWYTDAVKWAYSVEIVNGRTDTTFVPNGDITRAEFAAILYRYMAFASLVLSEKRSGDVSDIAKIPAYARDAVTVMFRAEVINGREGNVFDPSAKITRAEAAAMIERFSTSAEKDTAENDKLSVVFIGNSITLCQNTAGHFEAISEGTVKSTDFSKNGYYLKDHLLLFENIKPWAEQCRNADIVIFQEYGGGYPFIGENTELQELNETYHIGGSAFCRGENIMGRFIELFGDGTDYYSYSCNLSSGLMKYDEYVGFDGSKRQSTNEAFLKAKEIIREQYGFEHIYVSDLAAFEPELGLESLQDTFPDYIHPTPLMAYSAALTLYCKLFDVPAASCNNGLLKPDNIPGETDADKAAFMERVKAEIQISLDLQK